MDPLFTTPQYTHVGQQAFFWVLLIGLRSFPSCARSHLALKHFHLLWTPLSKQTSSRIRNAGPSAEFDSLLIRRNVILFEETGILGVHRAEPSAIKYTSSPAIFAKSPLPLLLLILLPHTFDSSRWLSCNIWNTVPKLPRCVSAWQVFLKVIFSLPSLLTALAFRVESLTSCHC